jgi:hypothetical protein
VCYTGAMRRESAPPAPQRTQRAAPGTGAGAPAGYQPPSYQVICLACEISAYAPDGDPPLF